MKLKNYIGKSVLDAAKERVSYTFDNFENIFISFSGGKDSSTMFHLVMEEAKKRNRVVGVMLIDFEAQYKKTIEHAEIMFEMYKDHTDRDWETLLSYLCRQKS